MMIFNDIILGLLQADASFTDCVVFQSVDA